MNPWQRLKEMFSPARVQGRVRWQWKRCAACSARLKVHASVDYGKHFNVCRPFIAAITKNPKRAQGLIKKTVEWLP